MGTRTIASLLANGVADQGLWRPDRRAGAVEASRTGRNVPSFRSSRWAVVSVVRPSSTATISHTRSGSQAISRSRSEGWAA